MYVDVACGPGHMVVHTPSLPCLSDFFHRAVHPYIFLKFLFVYF